ncbi:MAG: ABC transporter permease [Gammaproteobacteria bacterium]|nr:ABC transporter permease [Gammaproteobacteria bacterium]MBU1443438.1 ABC transporter permease [Gammaproteobacteria bacterium]MBU2285246.1 ABC transporter permease [Gammaproteobacteria bacterium]MBU2410911.1 ABC transporter permease [Gammaproteobacteria bacterium]
MAASPFALAGTPLSGTSTSKPTPGRLPGRRALYVVGWLAALIAVWWLLTTGTGVIGSGRFASPQEVFLAFRQVLVDGYSNARWHEHVARSLMLVTSAFAVASAFGVALGLAMGASRRVEAFANPIFLFLRPIPPLAWIPLAIVWLGLGDAAKIMVIFVAAFVPSVINSYSGVRQIDRTIFEASAMLDVTGWRYWREVLIPGAMPSIFTGLRLSLQASWTTLVAAELVGATAGLGQILNQAAQDIYPGMILVGMMSVALWGWLMTLALGWVEKRATPWKVSA